MLGSLNHSAFMLDCEHIDVVQDVIEALQFVLLKLELQVCPMTPMR
jgi:hypothetical protein